MTSDTHDLAADSAEELLRKYVEYVQLLAATEHWGREKRYSLQKQRVLDALKSRSDGSLRPLLPLRAHPDPVVQLDAAVMCKPLDADGYHKTMEALIARGGKIAERAQDSLAREAWYEKHPPSPPGPPHPIVYSRTAAKLPTGMTRVELEERVRSEFPADLAREVLELARPAIAAWPRQPRESSDPRASCLGGLPLVPKDWTWPALDGEPMLFVGHFNCAELAPLAGARVFPATGIIAIFGEHDHLHCCTVGRNGEGAAVFYWPDVEALVPASEPIQDFEPLPRCGLVFYESYSLPDPRSDELDRLPLDKDQRRRYSELHTAVSSHGTDDRFFSELNVLQLLGWPNLVQCELFHADEPQRLLFQLGGYDNGVTSQDWGPGGAVYFTIPETDLAERRFDRVRLESQIT
jgi:uncharacterized protein YwqG